MKTHSSFFSCSSPPSKSGALYPDCDASVVISVVIFLIALNGVGFREMKKAIAILVLDLLWCNITKYLILNKERRYVRNKDIP